MDIKDQLSLAAACLDNLASDTLSPEARAEEQKAARLHVENLHDLSDSVLGFVDALLKVDAHLSTHPEFPQGNSKVHFAVMVARRALAPLKNSGAL